MRRGTKLNRTNVSVAECADRLIAQRDRFLFLLKMVANDLESPDYDYGVSELTRERVIEAVMQAKRERP